MSKKDEPGKSPAQTIFQISTPSVKQSPSSVKSGAASSSRMFAAWGSSGFCQAQMSARASFRCKLRPETNKRDA